MRPPTAPCSSSTGLKVATAASPPETSTGWPPAEIYAALFADADRDLVFHDVNS
jgi:hypothetical protein